MDESQIKSLREALEVSPSNVPLRMHLAQILINMNKLDEAETELQIVLSQKADPKAKLMMAGLYYTKEEYSTCNVILEELIDNTEGFEVNTHLLYTRALLAENEIEKAQEAYQVILSHHPDFMDEELDSRLRYMAGPKRDEFYDEEEEGWLQKPDVSFKDVGGMENVKKEIELKIIHPLEHPEIYKSYGKKIGGGILLYGPPGCGKTHIAKATAGQVNARFISVGLDDILDMWIGNSEKKLHEVFEIARDNAPCVLFFDEIDALGASRRDMKSSGGRHLINQFLQELDGMDDSNEGVLVLGATNAPWHLDSAFRRPGRFDRIIFVPPPDLHARESIFKLKMEGKPIDTMDFASLAKRSAEYSGADIEAVVDIAVEGKLEEAIRNGKPVPLATRDMIQAIKKHNATTKEWFASAKNFALYANESGLYDDILNYLKIKK